MFSGGIGVITSYPNVRLLISCTLGPSCTLDRKREVAVIPGNVPGI